jgi:hypothetical protein
VNRLILVVLAAFAAALYVASELGGTLGSGVVLGFSLGAGLAGLSTLYTRHVARTRPAQTLQASLLGFLIKLGALLFGGLAFRFVEPAAARADYRSFLIAFAAAVALVLPLGTWSVFHVRKGSSAAPAAPVR